MYMLVCVYIYIYVDMIYTRHVLTKLPFMKGGRGRRPIGVSGLFTAAKAVDCDGQTALHHAAAAGHEDVPWASTFVFRFCRFLPGIKTESYRRQLQKLSQTMGQPGFAGPSFDLPSCSKRINLLTDLLVLACSLFFYKIKAKSKQ